MRLFLSFAALLAFAGTSQTQEVGTRADSVFRAAEAKGFSGVVRIERGGRVVLEKGYGLADRGRKIAFTPSSVVQIGSNTKDFTTVSILQLQEKGKLDLADSLGKFFPAAPPDKRGITILQLIKHDGGFPLGLGSDFEPLTREQLIDRAMSFKLVFKPGEKSSYSNTGFALLAAIIEKTSGKTYDEYVRDNILTPLGLRDTGFRLPRFDERRLARGYAAGGVDAGTMLAKPHANDGPYWNLRGNGGMLSTVADMSAFYTALFETDKLLKPATRDQIFRVNEAIALAGSDLVNFFLYERDPRTKTVTIIASTNAEYRAPMVKRELASVIGGPGGRREITGAGSGVARRDGQPPMPAVAKLITDFVTTLNSVDTAALRRFVAGHFSSTGDALPINERLQRLAAIHRSFGTITVGKMTADGPTKVEVVIQTKREGEALLMIDLESAVSPKIRRMGVQVGGDG